MYTCPTSTAHPTPIATNEMGKFSSRNCLPRTWMPFWRRIWRQRRPASDAENVSVNAPKFDPRASAYSAPSRTRGSRAGWEVDQSWRTRARRIVAPMFVPQNYAHKYIASART